MKCDNDKQQLARWISNEMNEAERAAFEQHLMVCEACRTELETDQQVWDMMGEIPVPEPSTSLRPRFYAMLESYKTTEAAHESSLATIRNMFRRLWNVQPGFRLAYSFILVLAGLGVGYLVSQVRVRDNKEQIAALSSQVNEMKEMMMLSLLENPSASERIRGVSYTSEIKHADGQVVEALLATLNNDPNVNVRLMTLEALAQVAVRNATVREGLVQSIMEQESPLVQAALADVMLKLQEKRSVLPFRKLLQQKDLNVQIRTKIEQTITKLI
jgi:hypothetical protein